MEQIRLLKKIDNFFYLYSILYNEQKYYEYYTICSNSLSYCICFLGGIIGYIETELPGHMTIHSLNLLDQNRRLINTLRVKLRVKGKHVNISLNTILKKYIFDRL